MFEYELDFMQEELDRGNKVIYVSCDGDEELCSANLNEWRKPNIRYCVECKSRVRAGLKWLRYSPGKFIQLTFEGNYKIPPKVIADIKSANDVDALKSISNSIDKPQNNDIFEAAYSGLLTDSVSYKPVLKDNLEKLKKEILVAVRSTILAKELIEKYSPSKIFIYNGRLPRYRPFLRECQARNLKSLVYEYPMYLFEKYIVTSGWYLHDVQKYSSMLLHNYKSSNLSDEKKILDGSAWLDARINHLPLDLSTNFVKKQTFGKLPDYWDKSKLNVIFMLSSEAELSPIAEFKEGLVYPTQIDGLRCLLPKIAKEGVCGTVRMHPNSANDTTFISEISQIKIENRDINFIFPSSAVDSYELMKEADLVVTFGSTTGIEAAYLGMPVLNLGFSWYDSFGGHRRAVSHQNAVKILQNVLKGDFSDFPPKKDRIIAACKYGYAYQITGITPKFLKRITYFGGTLCRDGVEYEVKANCMIRLMNKTIDFPKKIIAGFELLLKNPRSRANFIGSPLRVFVQFIR
jgi:hypothetical protein